MKIKDDYEAYCESGRALGLLRMLIRHFREAKYKTDENGVYRPEYDDYNRYLLIDCLEDYTALIDAIYDKVKDLEAYYLFMEENPADAEQIRAQQDTKHKTQRRDSI